MLTSMQAVIVDLAFYVGIVVGACALMIAALLRAAVTRE